MKWVWALVKPFVKPLLVRLVEEEGECLQILMVKAIEDDGPEVIGAVINRWKTCLGTRIADAKWVPNFVKVAAIREVNEHAGQLEAHLKAKVSGGTSTVYTVLEIAHQVLLARVRAL